MKLLFFWKPLIWLAIICYGLFLPANELPVKPLLKIPHFDKMVHFALFFVLCLLLFKPIKKLKIKHYLWAPFISVLLGASLEITQHILSNTRSSNFLDFLANVTGILAATLFYAFFVTGKKWESLF
jgi:VanZ family protein